MRQPGLVEMQVLDIAVQQALDDLGVVKHAIIGRLGQRHDARLDRVSIDALQQRVGADLVLDRFDLELAVGDRADDAVMVARRFQEHRDRAGHDDRMQDRLVAVAIHHDHIARRHGVMPDHLVAGRGAVGDKEAVIGIEDPRRVLFGLANGAVVVQKLAQFLDRVADIGAQHVFTVELVIHLANGRFQEGHAAGMAGAVPRIGAILGVIQERLEERRLDAFQIGLGLADDVAGDEFRRILERMDKAVQLAQNVVGQVARGLGLAIDIDRHIGVFPAHFLDEVAQVDDHRVQFRAGAEFLVVDGQHKGRGARLLLGELRQIAIAGDTQHLEAFVLDGLGQGADAQARGVLGAEVFVDDDDGKAELHGILPGVETAGGRLDRAGTGRPPVPGVPVKDRLLCFRSCQRGQGPQCPLRRVRRESGRRGWDQRVCCPGGVI